MIRIQLSTVEEVCLAGQELFAAHAAESEPGQQADLDPDWDGYQDHEDNGRLLVLAAWDRATLAGYAVAIVYHPLHYRRQLICQQDVLYVGQQWRNTGLGLRLVQRLRQEARDRGAQRLLMHAKPQSRLEVILEALGLTVEETIYTEGLACPQAER